MNPIEQLKQEYPIDNRALSTLQLYYEKSEDKLQFLHNVVKDIGHPHLPCFIFGRDVRVGRQIQYSVNIFSKELQSGLYSDTSLSKSVPFPVFALCNNWHNFTLSDGHLRIGINLDADENSEIKDCNKFVTGYSDNPIANENCVMFRALKGTSIYQNYLFSKVSGDGILSVYDELYRLLPIREVKTYTIIYLVDNKTIREVTNHDFGKYGNILSTVDLKV